MVDQQKPDSGQDQRSTKEIRQAEKAGQRARKAEQKAGQKARKAEQKAREQERREARRDAQVADDYVPTGRDRVRVALIWVFEYWRELFNFRFDKYMIIQVIPGVYGLALTGLALGLVYLSVEAFLNSPARGLFYFFFAGPLAFLVCASILRALLEFYMVVFKIAEHVDELVGLRDTVDRLGGISDTVDEISTVTRRLPFWSAMAGRRRVRRTVERRQREAARKAAKQPGREGDERE